MERIVYVEVNPEQRLVLHGVKLAVEFLVILILEGRGGLSPKRLNVVDDIVLIGLHLLAVLPFGLLSESDGHGHELAVFVEQALYLVVLKVFLAIVGDVEDDVRPAVFFLHVVNGKGR